MKNTENKLNDSWNVGDQYEYFMGRWSNLMAPRFLNWLDLPCSLSWLDLGCGTGALSAAIIQACDPESLTSVDPSEGFLSAAKERLEGRGNFQIGNSEGIPLQDNSVDAAVSGLAFNFFPNAENAMDEMKRVTRPDGTIALFVWDYSGRIDLIRYFWDAAIKIDPGAKSLDEGVRFPICNPISLRNVFEAADLTDVEVKTLVVITHFKNFEDYWNPFLGGQGPAPAYLMSLRTDQRAILKENIFANLPFENDGSIRLTARAIAAKGIVNSK